MTKDSDRCHKPLFRASIETLNTSKNMEKNILWFLFLLFCTLQGGFTSSSSIDQQEKDRIIELPGLPINISFAHYSGYVTVNEVSGRNLFYWFIEAVEDPSSKPLVLWLQGGPGCSSIGFGEAEEIGPFHINPDGKTLYLNPYSWNQVASILFLEAPVGTGFSYSSNLSDIVTNGDKRTAEDSLVFLLKWFERFPQYRGRDFYITGESYAGHYIPQLAQAILGYQWPTGERSINFKGYMVGNGLADDYNDHTGVSDFLWTNGLISDTTYELRKTYCHNNSYLHISDECSKVADVVTAELGSIDIYSIYTPSCTRTLSKSEKLLRRSYKMGNINPKYDPCTKQYSGIYFNLPEVQKALHVNPGAGPFKWEICSDVLFHTWKDSASSMVNTHRVLIASGLRVWMFSGDTDTVIPVTSTRYSINDLRLPTKSPWRPWYDEGQVGGWTQGYSGLNFVTIRGAGHMVPLTKPKLALVLFKSFLSGTAMPLSAPSFRNS